jgi:hypothetical protein
VAPPAGQGIHSVIGRFGKSSCPGWARSHGAAHNPASAVTARRREITPLPVAPVRRRREAALGVVAAARGREALHDPRHDRPGEVLELVHVHRQQQAERRPHQRAED